jgi:glucose-6-phosphate isomerase
MSGLQPFGSIPEGRIGIDGAGSGALARALERCAAARAAQRIWSGDHELWKPEPAEIVNRLGWLRSPAAMRAASGRIGAFVEGVIRDGIADVLLLGMGGSSLAPEMFSTTFGTAPGHPRVSVLDSTDPDAVLAAERRSDPSSTLYLVSTKSGGTVETLSFFKYFHGLAVERLGAERAGRHFAAVTDPGSTLESAARGLGVREVFLNDPDIGGRFSALTFFGLVPAALCGVDTGRLLGRAEAMAARCAAGVPDSANPGVTLGSFAAGLALAGRDKLTLLCSSRIAGFGAWAEQLVAESTGKEGRGILPVAADPRGPGRLGGGDRAFVVLRLAGDAALDGLPEELAAAGHPVLEYRLGDPYDLGGELFRWEFATAVMGSLLSVNPFDQPDVESAKVQANRALAAFRERGTLPAPALEVPAADAAVEIAGLLDSGRPGDYVAVQAFVDPDGFEAPLREFGEALGTRSGFAVTTGFGPRFLHSTGQLHKGGPPSGIFVQLVTANPVDVAIPDDFGARGGSVGFGVLKSAQALGDLRALAAARRRVLRVNLGPAGPGAGELLRGITRALRA